jgi:hypothetical protein
MKMLAAIIELDASNAGSRSSQPAICTYNPVY